MIIINTIIPIHYNKTTISENTDAMHKYTPWFRLLFHTFYNVLLNTENKQTITNNVSNNLSYILFPFLTNHLQNPLDENRYTLPYIHLIPTPHAWIEVHDDMMRTVRCFGIGYYSVDNDHSLADGLAASAMNFLLSPYTIYRRVWVFSFVSRWTYHELTLYLDPFFSFWKIFDVFITT